MMHVLYHRFLSKHATHAPGFTKDTYFILFLCNSSNRHWHESAVLGIQGFLAFWIVC